MVFRGRLKGVSMKFYVGFMVVEKKLNGCLREFPRCFKDVSRKF